MEIFLAGLFLSLLLLFLELKLDTKECPASDRTHLHLFIKFIIKN